MLFYFYESQIERASPALPLCGTAESQILTSYTTSKHAGKCKSNTFLLLSYYKHLPLGDSQSRSLMALCAFSRRRSQKIDQTPYPIKARKKVFPQRSLTCSPSNHFHIIRPLGHLMAQNPAGHWLSSLK